MTNREICLDTAKKMVCGEREQDYGTPEDNFATIAKLWNTYLKVSAITPKDVSMMMALLKIARIATGDGTSDSFVDLAGYAACGYEIYSKRLLNNSTFSNSNTIKEEEDDEP